LEYLQKPADYRRVRAKLVEALRPGGYLLLGSTVQSEEIEQSWISRWLIRGTQINSYVGRHPALTLLACEQDQCACPFQHSLFQKIS